MILLVTFAITVITIIVLAISTPKLKPSTSAKVLFEQTKVFGESESRKNPYTSNKLFLGGIGMYYIARNKIHLQITDKELIIQPDLPYRLFARFYDLYFKCPLRDLSQIEFEGRKRAKINFRNRPSFFIESKRYKEILSVFKGLLPEGYVKIS